MKIRCEYCYAYRIEDDDGRRLETEEEDTDVCFDCEEWVEGDDGEI